MIKIDFQFQISCIIYNKFIKVTGLAHKGKGSIHGLYCTIRRAKAETDRRVKIKTRMFEIKTRGQNKNALAWGGLQHRPRLIRVLHLVIGGASALHTPCTLLFGSTDHSLSPQSQAGGEENKCVLDRGPRGPCGGHVPEPLHGSPTFLFRSQRSSNWWRPSLPTWKVLWAQSRIHLDPTRINTLEIEGRPCHLASLTRKLGGGKFLEMEEDP